jgi:hypothetical protein
MRAASGVIPAVGEEPPVPAGAKSEDVKPDSEPPPSAIKPRARRPATSPKRAAARKTKAKAAHATNGAGAPVDHYDDLEADEIVSLVESLEDDDLAVLLDYERANRSRPRVLSAIEGIRARREASHQA